MSLDVSLGCLAADSGAWQTQLVIPVFGLTRRGSPEGVYFPEMADGLERRNPGGGGNNRECPNSGKAVIRPELSL